MSNIRRLSDADYSLTTPRELLEDQLSKLDHHPTDLVLVVRVHYDREQDVELFSFGWSRSTYSQRAGAALALVEKVLK